MIPMVWVWCIQDIAVGNGFGRWRTNSSSSTDQVKVLLLLLLKQSKPGHSLRHGGATHDYLKGMPFDDVMVRGRWAVTKSAVHYIQQGRYNQCHH
jgi:hypothetical protein